MNDPFSHCTGSAEVLPASLPSLWPDARVIQGALRYDQHPPFRQLMSEADLISGVLVGADDPVIQWVQELARSELTKQVHLVLILPPAGPTRHEHLLALCMLIKTITNPGTQIDIRILPLDRAYGADFERFVLPPTCIMALNTRNGETLMSIGSSGNAGRDECGLGSLNLVFEPNDALRNEWRRWFQYLIESAYALTERSAAMPHLVPAKGDPKAAELWADYLFLCSRGDKPMPHVDVTTGEVVKTVDGKEVQAWDGNQTALDPLASLFQKVYAEGWLVTVDETTRNKPLTIPLKATLLGQKSEQSVGAVTRRQSFTLKILEDADDKVMEKYRKVTDLLELLSFPLSKGNRWLPAAVRQSLEKEVEARNDAGRKVLIRALSGSTSLDIQAFIARRTEDLRNNVNQMYKELGQGDELPPDKFEAIIKEVEARLTKALETRITPQLVFNKIQAPPLAGNAPDANWSQPLSLLSHAAEALRKSFTDSYFPRSFTGLTIQVNEFREQCNPFRDSVVGQRDFVRIGAELDFLESLLDQEDLPLKSKCQTVWSLTQGMPHFYFQTVFKVQAAGIPWPESFAIITAYPAPGQRMTRDQIADADRRLERELIRGVLSPVRIIGASPDASHTEVGWAAPVEWLEACEIGQRYGQEAIFYVERDELSISYCDERRRRVHLGKFSKRLREVSNF